MSALELREEPGADFAEYARISIAFTVERVLDADGREQPVERPWRKDYDAQPGNHPTDWPRRFDVSRWGVLSAWLAGARVGGAVIAFGTKELDLLGERPDLAVLWDVRVAAAARRRGVGSALFAAAEAWARARGCRELAVETQDVNVPACRLYRARGCRLAVTNPGAYPDLPNETQLLFYKELFSGSR